MYTIAVPLDEMDGDTVRLSRMRVLLALVLVASLGFSSVALAAETEVQKLQAQIKDLQGDVKRAGEAYSKAYWALDQTRAELATVDREIEVATAELAEANARLSQRAAEMYRTGGADYLQILLSTADFDDMLVRLEYVQRIGRQDAETIATVDRLKAELDVKRTDLDALKETQASEASKLKKEADRIEGQLKAQQKEYDKLQAKLKAAVAAEKAKTGTTTAKAGPNGMVFPVRGPNYYNDTWGAARSGGRSHKGTDIMAANGVPCVAVLSGTVRSKSNSLGGKTIWLTADNGWAFYYAHLSSYAVTSGRVSAGQVIGYVGSTGNASASAPHLHFEIHPGGGAAVNPYPYLRQMQ
ncbi:MAG: peptidoglycan DD-metalloendopeptidase family protein [Coriobacteriia bacterium]|nr:peptidoglycan DD-metalloendopeptidase family protein [Coriobacteriia bacterium]